MAKTAIKPYELNVVELFRFGDGTTVFVGPLTPPEKTIVPCRVEVLRDGVHLTEVNLVGERSGGRNVPEGYRAVFTADKLEVDLAGPATGLRLVDRAEFAGS